MMSQDALYHPESHSWNAGPAGLRAKATDFLWPIVVGVAAGWVIERWFAIPAIWAYAGGFLGAVLTQALVDGARTLFVPRATDVPS